MSVTFTKRKYVCKNCSHEGAKLCVFKFLHDIVSTYVSEDIEDYTNFSTDNKELLYEQDIERDEYGIICRRRAVKSKCDKCGSSNIEAIPLENFNNVLNFYPPSQPEQWLEGFEKYM